MGFGIFCILLGLILAAAGFRFLSQSKKERSTCSKRVTATVIGNEETCLKDDTGADTWAFCPRFRYVVSNVPVEATADWGTVNPRFHEGQHVTLYYDPQNPTHISVDDQKRTSYSMIGCIVFGILLAVFGILFLLFSI